MHLICICISICCPLMGPLHAGLPRPILQMRGCQLCGAVVPLLLNNAQPYILHIVS